MGQDLIKRREQVMGRADRALDAAWPARRGDDYVREMRWAAGELETIASEMQAKGFDQVEQSRTYRYLGSVYADLEPALGKDMLLKAKKVYQMAETLLEGQSDELERAKLNFSLGNTLRQIDPNDIEQLQEAKHRFLVARAYFAPHAPQYLAQVDAALQSVESLLRLAPLANAVKQNTDDMAALQKQLAAVDNVNEIAEKTQEVMTRGGGAAGMIGKLQTIIDTLPDNQKRNEKFADIQKQMQDLMRQALGNKELTPEEKQIFYLLKDRLKSDADSDAVLKDRAESLSGMLEEFGRVLSGDEKDVQALQAKLRRMREIIEDKFEMAHYLSHGIERPAAGSRAANLVELNWQLRRYLLEEMNRPEKGEEESKESLDLSVRASRVDKRIYEAGSDQTRAMNVEKEELCPLGLAIRNFSARMNTMPARPIWRVAKVPVDTNAVFYSGAAERRPSIAAVCRRSGLKVMAEPKGESYASARWKQLQKAVTTVFDLRVTEGPDMATVNYELGVAMTLGKPIVILIAKGQKLPFDVDIDPIVLDGSEDTVAIAMAIDQSVVWTYPRLYGDASSNTLEHVLSLYSRPHQDIYVDQTLRMLIDFRKAPDPLAITRTLVTLFDYLKDGETMLIHPRWSPVYAEQDKPRLFHVMPFKPKQWADRITEVTREVCEAAGVKYVRGDEVDEPNIIRSIWEEIAQATHVLVDLTGFNANVALELGIAHTLGKKILVTTDGDPKLHVFKSISRFRVKRYDAKRLKETLGREIREFLTSGHQISN
jgi:nucleoside 2-deoxyribosyltransferase